MSSGQPMKKRTAPSTNSSTKKRLKTVPKNDLTVHGPSSQSLQVPFKHYRVYKVFKAYVETHFSEQSTGALDEVELFLPSQATQKLTMENWVKAVNDPQVQLTGAYLKVFFAPPKFGPDGILKFHVDFKHGNKLLGRPEILYIDGARGCDTLFEMLVDRLHGLRSIQHGQTLAGPLKKVFVKPEELKVIIQGPLGNPEKRREQAFAGSWDGSSTLTYDSRAVLEQFEALKVRPGKEFSAPDRNVFCVCEVLRFRTLEMNQYLDKEGKLTGREEVTD